MCGIGGLISDNKELVRTSLSAMMAAQVHRGPDDGGEELLDLGPIALGLGARRLSIIDLSPAGHQPMIHPRTGDILLFSGEIYNFQLLLSELQAEGTVFRGHSDTEVLLHALARWGTDCISGLNGIYTLAFFNRQQRTLLLARDPLGIRPLYVASVPGAFLFANEVRAILASGLVSRQLDVQGVAGLLAYGAVQEPNTIFQEIREFPAGCWQVFDLDKVNHESQSPPYRYWTFPTVREDISEKEAISMVEDALESAVRDELVSDVPIGVFLSSGLDSTILASLAAKHSSKLRTFTVGFPDQPDMSESILAQETSQLLGAAHTDIQITNQDAKKMVLAWLQSMDQPSVDGLNTYIVANAVRSSGAGVAISGTGGDELFAGQPFIFTDVPRLKKLMRMVGLLPKEMRLALSSLATIGKSEAVKQKAADIAGTDGGILDLYLQRRRHMSNQQLAVLGLLAENLHLTANFMPFEALVDVTVDETDIFRSLIEFEARFYLGNMLLRDGDANCMASSLEVRVPMLNRRVVDLMFTLPGHILSPRGIGEKHLLRRAFKPLLRPALTQQKKSGFVLPIAQWMKGPLRGFCEDALADLKSSGILQPEGIDAIWKSFLQEKEGSMWIRAWTLCVLGTYINNHSCHR